MASRTSPCLVSLKIAVGRLTSQNQNTSLMNATTAIEQPVLSRSAAGFTDAEVCEAYFYLESVSSSYDIKMNPLLSKGTKFDVEFSQPQIANSQTQTEHVMTLKATATRTLTAENPASPIIVSAEASLTRRPTSQKPDSIVIPGEENATAQRAPTLTGIGCSDADACKAFFNLESASSEYNLVLENISSNENVFAVKLNQPKSQQQATANGDAGQQIFHIEIKITTQLS